MSACKVMLLGDIGVGKSSIVKRLVFDQFETSYKPTIGVDIYRYDVVPERPNDPDCSFIVWDTDGNFGDAIFRHVYIRDAAAAFIVCDLSRPDTFQSAVALFQGFKEALPGRQAIILANKLDLIVGEAKSQNLVDQISAKANAVPIMRTSAKSGHNIKQAFHETAATIQRRSA